MDLPSEIRNLIYSYVLQPQRIQIIRAKDASNKYYRLYHIQLPPRDPETQYRRCLPRYFSHSSPSPSPSPSPTLASKGEKKKEPTSKTKKPKKWSPQHALLFTSSRTAAEIMGLVYASTQFVFTSPKAIARFLKTIPAIAKSAINHVELKYTMYNEPRLSRFREIKLRSDRNWFMACRDIADRFPELNVLHVELGVFEAPIDLQIGEPWSLPVLAFQGKGKEGGGLRFMQMKVKCNNFSEGEKRNVERDIEKLLMDPIAYQMREDAKLARELNEPVRGLSVLKLVFK
ncbi:uncharacterized protein BJX67DRAFT_381691 [Aspergillus lucknowensis]|uniref:DUF7730 domain-containing protein n=1 Tax=Aspergillus lucknowensis TaxID=176173 RepID=A0ABR4LQF1_9EURO